MSKKKILITNNLWWLDYSILNFKNIKFTYYYCNNIFLIKLTNYYYFFLINKYNLNNLFFYNLDSSIVSNDNNNFYFIALQTFFYDLQILLNIKFTSYLFSLSKIYSGNTWMERELKEFNAVNFIGLVDNRKLLSNYNYNNNLQYNQFNTLINDINI